MGQKMKQWKNRYGKKRTFLRYDVVSGKPIGNPINKEKLSKEEMDGLFNCEDMVAGDM